MMNDEYGMVMEGSGLVLFLGLKKTTKNFSQDSLFLL
jgi:hypothetical protein